MLCVYVYCLCAPFFGCLHGFVITPRFLSSSVHKKCSGIVFFGPFTFLIPMCDRCTLSPHPEHKKHIHFTPDTRNQHLGWEESCVGYPQSLHDISPTRSVISALCRLHVLIRMLSQIGAFLLWQLSTLSFEVIGDGVLYRLDK